ncbi:MAG: polysaccharide biosynthesis/export family protein [Bacteroidales bacterium]|nr:polysaccharide biosynthesis/export family protein [Bacteroidales bacterium]
MKKRFKWWILAVVLLLPLSCATPKKLGLLRDLEYNVPEGARPAPELRLKVDDRVSIQVFSEEIELAAPFNAVAPQKSDDVGTLLGSTYGVDALGNIDFPVLGRIHVEGKTLNEVKKVIADEITRRGYIKEPVVKVELENFTVTVIGETQQSVMPVEGTSINLLQVIAASGGLDLDYAKLPDIMVVRTEKGIRTAYTVNLQSKKLFDSPVFYLQQNDIVYIKTRGLRLSSGGDLFLKVFTPAISAISAIAYMLLWTSR